MPVKVHFMQGGFVLSNSILGIGEVVACETLTVPATTARAVQSGEWVMLVSTEATACCAAYGTAGGADAAATAATQVTSAGFAVNPNNKLPVAAPAGTFINVKAFV